ncbi:MAG: LemA family protein [Erysipelotrichaceae bacterium]
MPIWLIIIIAVVIILALWFVTTYNSLVRLRTMCEEAFSTMDVYLKKRFDLIPNLVEVTKSYAKHEKETLESVISARNTIQSSPSDDKRLEAEGELTKALGRLMALAEAYPDLKANANFMDLSAQLKNMEDEISNARKYYNGVVKEYNIKIQSIPSNIVANIGGFKTKSLFEITNTEERNNVKVEF